MTRPSDGSERARSPIDMPMKAANQTHVAYVGEDKQLYGYMTVGSQIRLQPRFIRTGDRRLTTPATSYQFQAGRK